MAPKKKEKGGKDDPADEKIKLPEAAVEDIDADDEDARTKAPSEPEKKHGRLKGLLFKKWWIPALLLLVLIGGVSAAVYKFGLIDILKGKDKKIVPVDINYDNLKEETLSPFFIPPSADLSRGAIRVDLSVIWDGLASVRFKESEIRIRTHIYDYLVKASEGTEAPDSKKAVMEEEMGVIFRKLLGVKNLAISIKELKSI